MKRIFTVISICCIFSLTALAWPGKVTAGEVAVEVKKTVDAVVVIVTDNDLKKKQNGQKRRAALKQAIGRIFDYTEMARRSMGAHWKELTLVQQKEFTDLFASLLENTYGGKIESYNNEKVLYGKESVEGTHAELESRVITARGNDYTLGYRLLRKEGRWMVYDVYIEGVSLISNYRTQFNKIFNERGYSELVKKLRAKSAEQAE
ncbi:MAG: ABC transporter substrate-binding protein [Deltaproteobacteria bacterium]